MMTRNEKMMAYMMTAMAIVYYTGALLYIGSVLSGQYLLTLVP